MSPWIGPRNMELQKAINSDNCMSWSRSRILCAHNRNEGSNMASMPHDESGIVLDGPTSICCDSMSSMKMSQNHVFHSTSKHGEV